MKVNLVVNPIAGSKAINPEERIRSLLKDRISTRIFVTGRKGDAYRFARDLSGAERVIVAGGDGTINEVVNGIMSAEQADARNSALGIIPTGTANVLAEELGIPRKIEDALQLALEGKPRRVTLGKINDRYFTLMAGIGFDGSVVHAVDNGFLKAYLGKGAYLLSGLHKLMKYRPDTITLKSDDTKLTGSTAVISNARCYGGPFSLTPDASITDSRLDICLLKSHGRFGLLRLIFGVLLKQHLRFKEIACFKGSDIELGSSGEVHVQIDGDFYGTLPVKIRAVKDALNLIWRE